MGSVVADSSSGLLRVVRTRGGACRAFTLVEVLVVAALVTLLLSLSVPAVRGMMESSTRAAAVGQMMGILESARAVAIAQRRPSYVAFADASSGSDYRFRAAAVFLEAETPAGTPVAKTAWSVLPIGYSLDATDASTALNAPKQTGESGIPQFRRPGEGGLGELPYIKFSETGAVLHPADAGFASVLLFPGFVDDRGQLVSQNRKGGAPSSERISLSVFTGIATFASRNEKD